MPSKHKALSSNPSNTTNKTKQNKKTKKRAEKQNDSCHGHEGGEEWDLIYRVSVWRNEKVLEMDGDDRCTTI
jgi:hypothetical protein